MRRQALILVAMILVAVAGHTQSTPSAQSSSQQQQEDSARARAEAANERAKAQAEAAKARAQAKAEAAKARAEAAKVRAQAAAARSSAYLGVVDPRTVTPEDAASLKLKPGQGGVLVSMVDHDSPAGKAGIKENDVVLSLNGQKTQNVDALRRVLREAPTGKPIPLEISRNGQLLKLNVHLAKRPQFASIAIPPMPPMPRMDFDIPSFTVLQFSRRNGAVVEDLSPQLADYFGVKGGEGVLVRSVDRGSAADTAGLKAGDIIVKAGNETITCSADWTRVLREHHSGTLAVNIVRDKREQNITMKLPEQTSDASAGEFKWQGFDSPAFHQQMKEFMRQMEKLGPQLEREAQVASAHAQRILQIHRKEIERAQSEAQRAAEQLRKSLDEGKKE